MSAEQDHEQGQASVPPAERFAAVLERLEPTLDRLAQTMLREHRSAGIWALFKRGGMVMMFLLGLLIWAFAYGTALGVHPDIVKPTLAQIEITGQIGGGTATANAIVPLLTEACAHTEVKGVVLHISSPGGSPADAERIGAAVDACKSFTTKAGKVEKRPVVAVIDGLGASAAYLIAIHADKIVANSTGMVGSIGVIIEGLKYDGLMKKVGVSSYTYASGDLKSMLSPYTEDTPAQQAVAKSLAVDAMQVFKADVIARRPHLVQNTPDLWSGRVWVAGQAKTMGLIDGVGLLEPTERSEFKGLDVRVFAPQRDIRSLFAVSTWVREFRAQMFGGGDVR